MKRMCTEKNIFSFHYAFLKLEFGCDLNQNMLWQFNMLVKFKKALEQLAQEISSNHRYEVHPIGGEKSSWIYIVYNNLVFNIIAVLNKSEKVLGCKSK